MEIFNAVNLQIPKGKTLNDLAEDAKSKGEASLSINNLLTAYWLLLEVPTENKCVVIYSPA